MSYPGNEMSQNGVDKISKQSPYHELPLWEH